MTIPTYEISAELRAELHDAVTWWRNHGRPDLTDALALREALEDWLAALRAEQFGDADIPTPPPSLRVLATGGAGPEPRVQGSSRARQPPFAS